MMAPRGSEAEDPQSRAGISSEVAVTALTLITVVLAVLVYVFAITFL